MEKIGNSKEFLYVGYYIDEIGRYLLKIGTTDNLKRRQTEHNRNYKKPSSKYRMPEGNSFIYLWHIPLSKYNTIRYEDKNRELWKETFGEETFVRNDRFLFDKLPEFVEITIRKTYKIPLGKGGVFVHSAENKIFQIIFQKPLDKSENLWYNGRPRTSAQGEICATSPIQEFFFRESLCNLTIDIFPIMCYNYYTE